MLRTLKPNCVLNLISLSTCVFGEICNKLFLPAKIFDPVLKLLEEGDKPGELDKLNKPLYGPTRVPCEKNKGW